MTVRHNNFRVNVEVKGELLSVVFGPAGSVTIKQVPDLICKNVTSCTNNTGARARVVREVTIVLRQLSKPVVFVQNET